MSYKATSLVISLVVISMIVGVIGVFSSSLATKYSSSGYSALNLDTYDKMENLTSHAEEIKTKTDDIKEKTGILDIIGGYFSDAYNALKVTKDSYSVVESLGDAAIQEAELGQTGEIYKNALLVIMIIIFFVGIILSAVMKWWL